MHRGPEGCGGNSAGRPDSRSSGTGGGAYRSDAIVVVVVVMPMTLLDPIEEPFDLAAGAVEIRAEADRIANRF